MQVANIPEKVREMRLRWCGYLERTDEGKSVKRTLRCEQEKEAEKEEGRDRVGKIMLKEILGKKI